jgi:hypothetical protein
MLQGDAHVALGEVHAAAGRTDEARAAFQEAAVRYRRKGNEPAAARVNARLSELV